MTSTTPAAREVTIVLPHREVFAPGSAGAVAMIVQRIAAGPSRYRSRVVGPPFGGSPLPGVEFVAARAWPWLPLPSTHRYVAAVAQVLRRLPPGPVEVHNKPVLALWLARLFPGRPVSLFLNNDPRTMRGARTPMARGRLLQRLAHVVVSSDYLRRALLDGVGEAPGRAPSVLFNALDPAEVPTPVPPPAREPVILFVGRVVPDKGPDLFIAACARALPRLPGWRAEMIGADGFLPGAPDSAFVRGLRPAAAAAGVALLGARLHADVMAAMARAAIVVVPSRWNEPFGLAALEAMACGSALVCSGRGGLAEIMGPTGLKVEPEDAGAFADALVRLAQDPAFRASVAHAGRERAWRLFSIADAVAALDDMRDRAGARHRRGD